jgi:hypothetical protein
MRLIRVARQKMHRDAPNFRALAAPFAAVPLVVAKVASSVVQSAVSEVPACFAVVRLRSAQFGCGSTGCDLFIGGCIGLSESVGGL